LSNRAHFRPAIPRDRVASLIEPRPIVCPIVYYLKCLIFIKDLDWRPGLSNGTKLSKSPSWSLKRRTRFSRVYHCPPYMRGREEMRNI